MNEPKPFASLSSGLLARKGAARPAMRPQGFGQGGAALEDLGWNDMGFEPPKPAAIPAPDGEHDAFGEDLGGHPRAHPSGLTPVQSPVHSQQAHIADHFAGEEEADEDELDETAELYDPNALDETDVDPDEEEEEEAFEPEQSFAPEPTFEPEPVFEPQPVFETTPAFEPAPPVFTAPAPVETPRAAPRQRSAPGGKSKAAFTLRLEQERHLKLRLACAVNGRSAQQLVTDALDQLLAGMPELDAMAQTAKRKG